MIVKNLREITTGSTVRTPDRRVQSVGTPLATVPCTLCTRPKRVASDDFTRAVLEYAACSDRKRATVVAYALSQRRYVAAIDA